MVDLERLVDRRLTWARHQNVEMLSQVIGLFRETVLGRGLAVERRELRLQVAALDPMLRPLRSRDGWLDRRQVQR